MTARAQAARAVVALLALLAALGGCGSSGRSKAQPAVVTASPTASPSPSPTPTTTRLTVLAAASLTEAFTDLGAAFERRHSGTKVRLSFAGSQSLAAQVRHGVKADVFASADTKTLTSLAADGALGGPQRLFARNSLVIVVGRGNPKGLRSLHDLAKPGLKVVLAAPGVPVGKYGQQALRKAQLRVKPVSLEDDVKAVVSKVALGEADAGIAYVTDVQSAMDKVEGVPIPSKDNVVAVYPIAVLRTVTDRADAQAFTDFVLSADGQAILLRYGFLPPP